MLCLYWIINYTLETIASRLVHSKCLTAKHWKLIKSFPINGNNTMSKSWRKVNSMKPRFQKLVVMHRKNLKYIDRCFGTKTLNLVVLLKLHLYLQMTPSFTLSLIKNKLQQTSQGWLSSKLTIQLMILLSSAPKSYIKMKSAIHLSTIKIAYSF